MFLFTSKDDMSLYTYQTIEEGEEVNGESDSMVGVEVQVEEEEKEQPKIPAMKPHSDLKPHVQPMLYISELKARLVGQNEEVPSPSNYYDATSPSAYIQEGETYFQGSEEIPMVHDHDGYYEDAEKQRYRKIQALHGTGWQGPIEDYEDDVSL